MGDTPITVPAQYLPLLDWAYTGTIVFAALWLLSWMFIAMRRNASDLTPVLAADYDPKARPDFLKINDKKRKAALERGQDYSRQLDKTEAEQARREARKSKAPLTLAQRIFRLVSLLMSIFSLATMIGGAIFQVTYITGLLKNVGAWERFVELVEKHPIGFTVASIVILYHVVTFFTDKKWEPKDELSA
jgi:hypothetical protein